MPSRRGGSSAITQARIKQRTASVANTRPNRSCSAVGFSALRKGSESCLRSCPRRINRADSARHSARSSCLEGLSLSIALGVTWRLWPRGVVAIPCPEPALRIAALDGWLWGPPNLGFWVLACLDESGEAAGKMGVAGRCGKWSEPCLRFLVGSECS